MRSAVALAVAASLAAGCTPKTAPAARSIGKVLSIGGVIGMVGSTLATRYTSHAHEMLVGFSVISGVGIVTYATGELSQPEIVWKQETLPQRNHRWAKILTERASGAAREGRCARVRRLEARVQRYDAAVHDLVFMKDPEILRCLGQPAPESGLFPSENPTTPPLVPPSEEGPTETPPPSVPPTVPPNVPPLVPPPVPTPRE